MPEDSEEYLNIHGSNLYQQRNVGHDVEDQRNANLDSDRRLTTKEELDSPGLSRERVNDHSLPERDYRRVGSGMSGVSHNNSLPPINPQNHSYDHNAQTAAVQESQSKINNLKRDLSKLENQFIELKTKRSEKDKQLQEAKQRIHREIVEQENRDKLVKERMNQLAAGNHASPDLNKTALPAEHGKDVENQHHDAHDPNSHPEAHDGSQENPVDASHITTAAKADPKPSDSVLSKENARLKQENARLKEIIEDKNKNIAALMKSLEQMTKGRDDEMRAHEVVWNMAQSMKRDLDRLIKQNEKKQEVFPIGLSGSYLKNDSNLAQSRVQPNSGNFESQGNDMELSKGGGRYWRDNQELPTLMKPSNKKTAKRPSIDKDKDNLSSKGNNSVKAPSANQSTTGVKKSTLGGGDLGGYNLWLANTRDMEFLNDPKKKRDGDGPKWKKW